jgi:hypothetical protein
VASPPLCATRNAGDIYIYIYIYIYVERPVVVLVAGLGPSAARRGASLVPSRSDFPNKGRTSESKQLGSERRRKTRVSEVRSGSGEAAGSQLLLAPGQNAESESPLHNTRVPPASILFPSLHRHAAVQYSMLRKRFKIYSGFSSIDFFEASRQAER